MVFAEIGYDDCSLQEISAYCQLTGIQLTRDEVVTLKQMSRSFEREFTVAAKSHNPPYFCPALLDAQAMASNEVRE